MGGRPAQRVVANAAFGYSDRIGQRDAAVGEASLMAPYVDQLRRLPSLPAFDDADAIADGVLVPGDAALRAIERRLARSELTFLHADLAVGGRFVARADRT